MSVEIREELGRGGIREAKRPKLERIVINWRGGRGKREGGSSSV